MARTFASGQRMDFASLPTAFPQTLHVKIRTTLVPSPNPCVIMARWNSSSRNGPGVFFNGAGNVTFDCYNATASQASVAYGGGPVNDGNWHSILFSPNGSAPGSPNSLWVDGVLVGTANAAGVFGCQSGLTMTWNNIGFWNPFLGEMQDVALWDVLLTTDEAIAMARGQSPSKIRRQSLVLHVPWIRNDTNRWAATTGSPTGSPGFASNGRVIGGRY